MKQGWAQKTSFDSVIVVSSDSIYITPAVMCKNRGKSGGFTCLK